MSFIRTVLGDIAPSELGVCYAHEHIIIDPSYPTQETPDFLLDSVECGITELKEFHNAGGRAMVDSMPCDAGRNAVKLAQISHGSGVHIVCPTGLHLPKYYPHGHWGGSYSGGQLAELFIADIQRGIDANDYSGPAVERTPHRAGIIKIATGGETLSAQDAKIFRAAAHAHRTTGCPILTHVEQGIGALAQVTFLQSHGVDLRHVVLSHTDRNPSMEYHRSLLATGVNLEYDSAFRWKKGNPTLDLLEALLPEFGGQLLLGMDAARRSYWRSYGGQPGLTYLLTDFRSLMLGRGISAQSIDRIFIENPSRAYAFKPTQP